jgi:glycogen phosphorylase
MTFNVEYQSDMLVSKIKHYLITTMGRVTDEANADEFYRAFCFALREEVMINWLATNRTYDKYDVRKLYYLSMEYLPGRLLGNNISNICALELVQRVLRKLNRNFNEISARESDPGLGNGGLGRLASCYLDSLATQHYPAQAYGLRYQYGIFEQQIWDGVQIEAPDTWLINEYPWEFRRDLRKVFVKYCGRTTPTTNIHGDEIQNLHDYEEVWAVPYDTPVIGYNQDQRFSVVNLCLWTTKDSPRNFQLQRYNAGRLDQAAENTTLTDVLYPSDHHETGKRIRLKQEYLLVSASLQDIIRHYLSAHDNFRSFVDKVRIQINDTHPALVISELMRILTKRHDIPWKTALEMTQACTSYTNHTILSEALEQWDQNLMNYLLPRQAKVIERLNLEFCNVIRSHYPYDEDKVRRMSIIENSRIRMAHLAIYGSHKVNGVAELHTNILKSTVFKDFYEMNPEKFINVTNGVTPRRWLLHSNPDLAQFITERIGNGWINDFSQISRLQSYASDPKSQEEFLTIKRKNKQKLIDFIDHDYKMRDSTGTIVGTSPIIDIDSIFDVQIKRIHEYKRQLLNALHIVMLYQEILDEPDTKRLKRTFIFAGKAAAGYETAKNIIRFIYCLAKKINRDHRIKDKIKVIFVENYNVSKAEIIIPSADLSEQISTAGMEASGTGNMKLTINGALTIGTDDGANIEMKEKIGAHWWPFTFGCSSEEIMQLRNNYNSWEICSNNVRIRRALESLRDRTFAQNDNEHQALNSLYNDLLEGHFGQPADRFFVLKDLESYYEKQKQVEELYSQPSLWAEYALHNIAGMGTFSSDYSIQRYAQEIWGITPLPPDEELLEKVRHEYSEHDKCRIY